MGLTIHYTLRTALTKPENVRTLVTSLRHAARKLPFHQVSAIKEFRGQDADFEHGDRNDPDRWLKIQAGRYLEVDGFDVSVKPRHIIAFTVHPGDGCEPANFGFCRYPAEWDGTIQGRTQRLATQLIGWTWSSFCKTQYASDRRWGGIENFLRCHVGLVKLLDLAAQSELIRVDVHDESKYFERRDAKQLINTVGEWNQFIAAQVGMFQDQAEQAGMTFESAITGFADFEHLEAKGCDQLRKRQNKS